MKEDEIKEFAEKLAKDLKSPTDSIKDRHQNRQFLTNPIDNHYRFLFLVVTK